MNKPNHQSLTQIPARNQDENLMNLLRKVEMQYKSFDRTPKDYL